MARPAKRRRTKRQTEAAPISDPELQPIERLTASTLTITPEFLIRYDKVAIAVNMRAVVVSAVAQRVVHIEEFLHWQL